MKPLTKGQADALIQACARAGFTDEQGYRLGEALFANGLLQPHALGRRGAIKEEAQSGAIEAFGNRIGWADS